MIEDKAREIAGTDFVGSIVWNERYEAARLGILAGLEMAAKLAENHGYGIDLDEWQRMTKKEHGAYACHSVAQAIRALGSQQ